MSRLGLMIAALAVGAFALAAAAAADPDHDTLKEYATKCDAAVGETVPGFDCDAGFPVPEGHDNGKPYGTFTRVCDFPNVLNHECDPGSRFQVLKETDKVAIVAHCRKKRDVDAARGKTDDGLYGDIAVIQYSKTNGATCFYQQLENEDKTNRLKAKVQAPSTEDPAWFTPAATANVHCGECHDNGPFIRSPYLSQLVDNPAAVSQKAVLPGSHDDTFNNMGDKYYFVGKDFKSWKLYTVQVSGNRCNGCHRMGVSNLAFLDTWDPTRPRPPLKFTDPKSDPCGVVSVQGGGGSSRVFGIIATLPAQCMKTPGTPTWMIPPSHAFSQANLDAANEIRDCAMQAAANNFNSKKTLPAGCIVKPLKN